MVSFETIMTWFSRGMDKLPEISLKLRDRVCYHGGVKVEYGDMTRFTLGGDGKYRVGLPVGKKLEGKVVDVLPFICIGMASVGAAREDGSGDCITGYTVDMLDGVVGFRSFREAVDVYSEITSEGFSVENVVNVAFSLNACHPDPLFQLHRNTALSFFALALANRKEFTRVLFKVMQQALVNLCSDPWKLDSPGALKQYGTAEYTTQSGTIRKLTDAQGIGYMLLLKLTAEVYNQFWEFPDDALDEVNAGIDECISSCIGMDIAGRYVRGRGFLPASRDVHSGISALEFVCLEPDKRINIDAKNETYREAYENAFLYKRVFGVSDEISLQKLGCPSMRWFSPHDLCRELGMLAFDYPECAENLLLEADKAKTNFIRMCALEQDLQQLKQEQLSASMKQASMNGVSGNREVEALKSRLQEMEWQLSQKSEIIGRLSTELSDLKACMANYYSADEPDEPEDEVEAPDEDLTEMIRYINDFKILMVGGRSDLVSRLAGIGWENVVSIDNATVSSSTLPKVDFAVVNTGFVSHKIVYLVNSRYDRDSVMYYNGTNIGQLVRSVYDFVKRFLEGGIEG